MPSLEDLNLSFCNALAINEETYATLGKIATLTKLDLSDCDMKLLSKGFFPNFLLVSNLPTHSPKDSEIWHPWRTST